VDRVADGDHPFRSDAGVVAGEPHAPLGEWHEDGIVNLELHRQLDLAAAVLEADRLDAGGDRAQHRRVRGVSNRAALKLVGGLTCSIGFCGEASEPHRVSGEPELRREQRAVRSARDEDVVHGEILGSAPRLRPSFCPCVAPWFGVREGES